MDSAPDEPPKTEHTTVTEPSKADVYYDKAWKSYWDVFADPDADKMSGYSRVLGYLTMAYKAAGDDPAEKRGIAGFTALILTHMEDYKNAGIWAKREFAINPDNLFSKLSWYFVELDKLVGHKDFVTHDDGSWFGFAAILLTTRVDAGRVQGKIGSVKKAGIEAAKAVEKGTRADSEPLAAVWLIWVDVLLAIIDNMWANDMKEPYLCNVLLNLPWNKLDEEDNSELADVIEEIEVQAHGYLGRLN